MKLSQEHIRKLVRAIKNHSCEPAFCCVQLAVTVELPSRYGESQVCGFASPCDGKEHTAIIKGNILDKGLNLGPVPKAKGIYMQEAPRQLEVVGHALCT